MPKIECVKLGLPSEFESPIPAELAGLAGKTDEFDTCDLRAKYGDSALLDADLQDIFGPMAKDSKGDFDFALSFYQEFPKKKDVEDMILKNVNSLESFLKQFFGTTAPIREKYLVFSTLIETELLTKLVLSLFENDGESMAKMVIWACGEKNVPSDSVADLVFNVAASILMSLPSEAAKDDVREPLSQMIVQCEASRDRAGQPAIGGRLQAIANKLKEQSGAPKANPDEEYSGNVKVGAKLEVPTIAKKLKGKKTIVFGWSQFCPACHKALPGLKKFLAQQGKNGVQFVGAVPTGGGDLAKMKQLQDSAGVKFDNFVLTENESAYMPNAYPYFILVNADGTVARVELGWSGKLEEWFNEGGKW